jgi:hypothetical protein
MLIRHLLRQGRAVVLLDEGFPAEVRARVLTGLAAELVPHPSLTIQNLRLEGM